MKNNFETFDKLRKLQKIMPEIIRHIYIKWLFVPTTFF